MGVGDSIFASATESKPMEQLSNKSVNQFLSPLPFEELAENCSALVRKYPLNGFELVIQLRVVEDRQGGTTRTGFGVSRAKDHTLDARMGYSPCTHCTRLDCNIERASAQAVVPELPRGTPQSENLCVSRRITQVDGPVVRTRDHFAIVDDDGSDRDFVFVRSARRLAQGAPHEGLVLIGIIILLPTLHGIMLPRPRRAEGAAQAFHPSDAISIVMPISES